MSYNTLLKSMRPTPSVKADDWLSVEYNYFEKGNWYVLMGRHVSNDYWAI